MNFRNKIKTFTESHKDYPLLTGFMCGFYPLLSFYSANYESINSIQHLCFFIFLFLFLPSVLTYVFFKGIANFPKTAKYKTHFLFIIAIEGTATFLSQVQYLTLKKKLLLALLIVLILLSVKFHNQYKKVLILLMLLGVFPAITVLSNFISKQVNDTKAWMQQNDHITEVKFVKKPNIYFIEPDGYTGKKAMNEPPYSYHDTLYDYLSSKSFTVYNNTISNYPASLASNASMFAMKHHYLSKILPSSSEMRDARNIISGNNPVVDIFKKNNYKTFFIVEDEYFQKNFSKGNYDFYNIKNAEIPYFSDDNSVKKDVYLDLKKCISAEKNSVQPKFYFIEKLLPHHISYKGSGVENERKEYLQDIESSNKFLKKTIELIELNDPSAIILIVGDHGGWVGIENSEQMYTTKDPKLIRSIFSNLIAIRWNNQAYKDYDAGLRSNVNIFRILFAYLSEDKSLLENLQKNDAYNIHNAGFLSRKANKVITR
jgi:hypothetical protein